MEYKVIRHNLHWPSLYEQPFFYEKNRGLWDRINYGVEEIWINEEIYESIKNWVHIIETRNVDEIKAFPKSKTTVKPKISQSSGNENLSESKE